MKGDFTRMMFRPKKHYSSVRMQQGRVQLDTDWNEAMEIVAYRNRRAMADLIGGSGAPRDLAAFGLMVDDTQVPKGEYNRLKALSILPSQTGPGTFLFSPGRYYVDGILCENDDYANLTLQPDLPGIKAMAAGLHLIYLDVWERHITALEDPVLKEVALGGADTTTRTKTVWQVKALKVGSPTDKGSCSSTFKEWNALIGYTSGRLAARTHAAQTAADPCIIPASAGYRRLENQLYRVEIHDGGAKPTFTWSRENGSVVMGVQAVILPNKIRVTDLGRDQVLGIGLGQWIELVTDDQELLGQPGALVQITGINDRELTLDLGAATLDETAVDRGLKARRWESSGAIPVSVPAENGGFIPLEGGVEVRFEAGAPYRTGDYWLIPARTITGEIEWPMVNNLPALQSPAGVEHHYCRLGLVRVAPNMGGGMITTLVADCRQLFAPLVEEGISVTKVQVGPVLFDVNATVQISTMLQGIQILCNRAVAANAVENLLACTVTVQLPYVLDQMLLQHLAANAGLNAHQFLAQDAQLQQPAEQKARVPAPKPGRGGDFKHLLTAFGFRPLALPGKVTVTGESITWAPESAELLSLIDQTMTQMGWPVTLQAGLLLRGNLIWAADNPKVYLDGESYRQATPQGSTAHLPTGDSHRGGNLELFFRIGPNHK